MGINGGPGTSDEKLEEFLSDKEPDGVVVSSVKPSDPGHVATVKRSRLPEQILSLGADKNQWYVNMRIHVAALFVYLFLAGAGTGALLAWLT